MLERQTALLRHLTDPLAYDARAGEGLLGSDKNIKEQALQFLGRGALGRRVNKVRTKLRVTVGALGDDFSRLMNDFAHLVPPNGVRGIEAAEQFQLFLETHCQKERSKTPYLDDLCRLELAMARVARPEEELPYFGAVFAVGEKSRRYRIVAGCEAVECVYDIRPLFDRSVPSEIAQRKVLLGVFYASGKLRVLEVTPDIFSFVGLIRNFKADSVELVRDNAVQNIASLEQLKVIEAV
jgi:hypothetical protein